VYVLEGLPPAGMQAMTGVEFGKTTVWIAVADGLLRKTQTLNKEGEVAMTATRTDVEVNVDLPDSLFTFTPPEGVQVMDMTEMVLKKGREMRAAAKEAETDGE
jgi:outer membrane lipoprotein-sorting protein